MIVPPREKMPNMFWKAEDEDDTRNWEEWLDSLAFPLMTLAGSSVAIYPNPIEIRISMNSSFSWKPTTWPSWKVELLDSTGSLGDPYMKIIHRSSYSVFLSGSQNSHEKRTNVTNRKTTTTIPQEEHHLPSPARCTYITQRSSLETNGSY